MMTSVKPQGVNEVGKRIGPKNKHLAHQGQRSRRRCEVERVNRVKEGTAWKTGGKPARLYPES